MIRTAIFGAGQAGRMVLRWLPASHEPICYIDNNKDKQGTHIEGLPVVSLDEALAMQPDRIWIATLNTDSAATIEKQVRDAGFEGTLRYAHAFRDAQDIRFAELRLIAEEIKSRDIPGAIAELGVFRGEFSAEMNRLLPEKEIYLFDTFEGFEQRDLDREAEVTGVSATWHPDFADTSIDLVAGRLPHPENARFVRGWFPESTGQLTGDETYALVSIDPDLYEPTIRGLKYFWPRMAQDGIIMIHDYNSAQFPGAGKAVREFALENNIMVIPLADLHGSAVIIKN